MGDHPAKDGSTSRKASWPLNSARTTPLSDYTPVFSLQPGTWPEIRRKSLSTLEKKIEKSSENLPFTRSRPSNGFRGGCRRSLQPGRRRRREHRWARVQGGNFGCGRPSRFECAGVDVPHRFRKSQSNAYSFWLASNRFEPTETIVMLEPRAKSSQTVWGFSASMSVNLPSSSAKPSAATVEMRV
jgi:hypothetical protein